jgi:hypothetical protein
VSGEKLTVRLEDVGGDLDRQIAEFLVVSQAIVQAVRYR